LSGFIANFRDDEVEGDVYGFGIAPFAISCRTFGTKILAFVILGVTVLFSANKLKQIRVKRALLNIGVVFIVFLLFGLLLFKTNSISYASNLLLYKGLLIVFVCLIVAFIEMDDSVESDGLYCFRFVVTLILILLLRNTDLVVMFVTSLVFQVIVVCVDTKLIKFFAIVLEALPISFAFSLSATFVIGYMTQFDGVIADLAPLLLFASYGLWISFSVLPLSFVKRNLDHDSLVLPRVLIALFGCVLINVLCMKSLPYSSKYLILGCEAEVIRESGQTEVYFAPLAGDRTAGAIEKTLRTYIRYDQDFQGYCLPRGPAFVERHFREHLPRFLGAWPKFKLDVVESWNGTRVVKFVAGNVSSEYQSIALVIQCGEEECVKEMDGFEEFWYRSTEFGTKTMIVRVNNVFSGFSIGFTVDSEDEVPVDVVYVSAKASRDRLKFRAQFPDFVQHFSKERFIAGTVLVSSRKV
jgi:hypothetical protein